MGGLRAITLDDGAIFEPVLNLDVQRTAKL